MGVGPTSLSIRGRSEAAILQPHNGDLVPLKCQDDDRVAGLCVQTQLEGGGAK